VLDTGQKIIGRTSATELLTGIKGGGALEKAVKGLPADLMIEVCQGFVAALQASFDPTSPYPKKKAAN
jgi:hypothetical protein